MLIDDFKISLGISSSSYDQFLIDYYLAPSIDKTLEYVNNLKSTTVELVVGTSTYDLTVVGVPTVANGIQELFYEIGVGYPWVFGRDFVIKDRKNLFFVDSSVIVSGPFTFKYNEYWSKPTLLVDTDMPQGLFPAVLQYAISTFKMDAVGGTGIASTSFAGYEEVREELMSVKKGDVEDQIDSFKSQQASAIEKMKEYNGGMKYNFYSAQVT